MPMFWQEIICISKKNIKKHCIFISLALTKVIATKKEEDHIKDQIKKINKKLACHDYYGIGIDLIEVERVAEKMEKKAGFKELVFSTNEIDYCETKTNKFEHYAARFAAKEAFFKAMGTGWRNGTAFNEIEITNDEDGKPEISFLGNTANTIAEMKLGKISVSLSHLKTMAYCHGNN